MGPILTVFSFTQLFLIHLAYAAVFTDPSQLTKTCYDFVVVGGGSAGNIVASRLSESNATVLVVEAGGSNEGVLSVIVPFLAPTNLPASLTTWNFTTTPQSALYNRTLTYPRGRILGGSGSINFLAYTRGANSEYDRWARLTHDPSWSWKNIEKYYLKNEHLAPPADKHNTSDQVDPALHGHGPIGVSVPGFPLEIDPKVLETSAEFGGKFTFNHDIQSGDMLGVSVVQSTMKNSRRSSSATAYLEPALNRSNLDVLINTQVLRMFASNKSKPTKFDGVELAQSANGTKYNVTAMKEIILSAGSIGTPQILLLSGIGPQNELEAKGIKCVVNLPDVGKNLQDHPIVPNYFVVNTTNTFDTILRNGTLIGQLLQQWNTTGQGWFADSPANTFGFIRVNESVLGGVPDPSAGSGAGHFEFLFVDGFVVADNIPPTSGNYITIYTAVLNPLSRGAITLSSTDPFVSPNINPGFLTAELDMSIMVEAVKTIRQFVGGRAWKNYIISRFGELKDAETEEEIEDGIRKSTVVLYHPACTARMSPVDATWGVLDPKLLVKGVSGVRVVDASAFPIIPATHTVAPVYILAEHAADIIKQAWKL